MTPAEALLVRGCVGTLDLWVELLGERDESVRVLRRLQEDGEPSEADLAVLRARLLYVAEMAHARPPIGHADPVHRVERYGVLLRAVPSGWFQVEERDGDEVWAVHGVAPLAIPELGWLYPHEMRGERLR